MAEPARKLDYDAPERQPSKRTEGALGKVVDLDAYRQKKRRQKQSPPQRIPKPKPEDERSSQKAENVADLNAYRKKQREKLGVADAAPNAPAVGKPGPMPTKTPLQMASALGAAQSRDRMSAVPMEETMPAGMDERVFLELDPQSYALREQTTEQKEKRRQASMMDVARKFSAPSGEMMSGPEEDEFIREESEESVPAEPAHMEPRRQMRIMGQLQQGRSQERMMVQQKTASVQNLQQKAMQQRQAMVKTNKNIRRIIKLIQAAGIETIIPLITLIIQLNLETINKWIFKIEIPGIILVDAYPSLDASDVITFLLDFLLVFAFLLVFLQTTFFIILGMIIWTNIIDLFSSLLEIFSGLF